jgi:hypothetical protein
LPHVINISNLGKRLMPFGNDVNLLYEQSKYRKLVNAVNPDGNSDIILQLKLSLVKLVNAVNPDGNEFIEFLINNNCCNEGNPEILGIYVNLFECNDSIVNFGRANNASGNSVI